MNKSQTPFDQTKEMKAETKLIIDKYGPTVSLVELTKYKKNNPNEGRALLFKLIESGMVIQGNNADKINLTIDPKQRSMNILIMKTRLKQKEKEAKQYIEDINDTIKHLDGLNRLCSMETNTEKAN